MFFDLHIHGSLKMALHAQKLGYDGTALVLNSKDYKDKSAIIKAVQSIKNNLHHDCPFQIKVGLEIQARNPADLKKQVQKYRDKVDVILVHGGDLKINRAATEEPRIDILCHPYRNRYDGGINHVLAVKAAEKQEGQMKKLSLVISVYNEEAVLEKFYNAFCNIEQDL